MYGAVVCPKCRKGFAVDLERRASSCPHCGRQVQVRRMKTHFTSQSPSLTAKAVGELNRKGRDLKAFGGPVDQKEPRPALTPTNIEIIVLELGEFSLDDLASRLAGRTAMEAEELLRRMLLLGLVYETSPGLYRKV